MWNATDGWCFFPILVDNKLELLSFFEEALSDEQIETCNMIWNLGLLKKGHYATWTDFCAAHGLDTPAE